MTRQRVGVWFGQLLNKNGEFPVLSIALDIGESFRPEGIWYYGAAHQDLVVDSGSPYADMVDSALLIAPSVGCALSRLGESFPSESYPEEPEVLELFAQRKPRDTVDWEPYVSP